MVNQEKSHHERKHVLVATVITNICSNGRTRRTDGSGSSGSTTMMMIEWWTITVLPMMSRMSEKLPGMV